MIYAGQSFFFLSKLLDDPLIVQRLVQEHFDDDGLVVKFVIASKIDCAYSTTAEFPFNYIPPVDCAAYKFVGSLSLKDGLRLCAFQRVIRDEFQTNFKYSCLQEIA